MPKQDYYKILGVDRYATPEAIKNAFRCLARRFHPDVTQGDRELEQQFKLVSEAYIVLSDPKTRRKYDRGFDPVTTVAKAFLDHADGQELLDLMIPVATEAPKRGMHLTKVVNVPKGTLDQGGAVKVSIPGDENRPDQLVTLLVPAGTNKTDVICFNSFGQLGQKGGETGNIYLILLEKTTD